MLGSGLDQIYPMENISLFYDIPQNGGGIISEYPPGSQAVSWHFPFRNRLISALSDRVLVMEARKRSGTLITVRYALDQGKDVYALPGRVSDPLSEGCNQMIADGAGVLQRPKELIDEIFAVKKNGADDKGKEVKKKSFKKKKDLYDMIGKKAISLEDLVKKSGKDAKTLRRELTELELSGLIREISKNYFILEEGTR